jgi:hypothetical protein
MTRFNILPHFLLTTAMMLLHNRINKKELKRKLQDETFTRRTISLYRYVEIDDPLGESIDWKVIASCHQCGEACDKHTNCANDDCHQLFIQCDTCRSTYEGCCSSECQDIFHLPPEEQMKYRGLKHNHYSKSKIYNRIAGPVDSIRS